MRVVAFASFALAASVVACELFTGSTDGYEALPKATDGGASEGGGGGSLDLRCVSAQDCSEAGAGQVCCVALSGTTAATAACQPRPCGGTLPVQLCATDAECSGSTCTLQACTLSGAAVTLRACGLVPTCTAK